MEPKVDSKNIDKPPSEAVEELLNHLGELVGEIFLRELKKPNFDGDTNK